MVQKEVGYGCKVVLINVCGVGSKIWVIIDDLIWLLSREEFALDTFVLCKKVEGRVIMFSGSYFK